MDMTELLLWSAGAWAFAGVGLWYCSRLMPAPVKTGALPAMSSRQKRLRTWAGVATAVSTLIQVQIVTPSHVVRGEPGVTLFASTQPPAAPPT